MHKSAPKFWFNPLITDGECTGHATLGTCYQLVQSVLKIGFALEKWWDKGRWVSFSTGYLVHGTCLVEILWLALVGPFLSFLSQTGIEKAPLPL